MNLIVLDIDGTMTLSEKHHLSAFADAMQAVGIEEMNIEWAGYTHITDTYIFKENYKAQFGEDPDESIMELLEELLTDSIQDFESPLEVPGAADFVELVKGSDKYVFAFATGSLYEPAKYKLDEAGISYEEEILIGSNGFDSREEIVTAAIEAAKAHYKVDKFDKIISAGDGMWDFKTAQNLDLAFLKIGDKNPEAFAKEDVKHSMADWLEIDIAYLDGVNK